MLHSSISILILIAGYLSYRYSSLPSFIVGSRHSDPDDNSTDIYWRRISTATLYGGLSIIAVYSSGKNFADFGLSLANFPASILPGAVIGTLLVVVNLFNYRTEDNLSSFPEIRKSLWRISTLAKSALTWVIYLLAYEILFRGYLLFSMYEYFGRWPAVAINILLYSLVHCHKGWKESLGAVPLGLVLCLVCLSTGSFWPAFIAHTCLALSSEWLSLHAHPGLTLMRNK